MSRSSMALWLGLGAGLAVSGSAAVYGLFKPPGPVEDVHVSCAAATPVARSGQALKVLVWNVQFAGTTKHKFFYDDGEAVFVPPEDVSWSLDAIAEVVRELDPDVILFQEIDRGSDRTGRVDQHRELLDRLDYPCHVTAPYHQVAYVPTPDHQHLGRVDMHLAVLSRVRLTKARRHQLALLDEAWYRRLFNLRRAVLEVEVPVDGGPDLTLLNTHLSAFSRGDGTLARQVDTVRRLALQASSRGRAVFLAGDFNSLPPGDDPSRLPDFSQDLYSDDNNPIEPLFEDLRSAMSAADLRSRPERFYTYAPYGLGRTDRTIDHVFTGGLLQVQDVSVRQDRIDISDHQPILVRVKLPKDAVKAR